MKITNYIEGGVTLDRSDGLRILNEKGEELAAIPWDRAFFQRLQSRIASALKE